MVWRRLWHWYYLMICANAGRKQQQQFRETEWHLSSSLTACFLPAAANFVPELGQISFRNNAFIQELYFDREIVQECYNYRFLCWLVNTYDFSKLSSPEIQTITACLYDFASSGTFKTMVVANCQMWKPTRFKRERAFKLFQYRCFQFSGRFCVWLVVWKTFSVFTGI